MPLLHVRLYGWARDRAQRGYRCVRFLESVIGTFHAFSVDKYARRNLGSFCFSFNRRSAMAEMTERIANAACRCIPCMEKDLRVAEAYR